jgi:hypothetical protein
MPTDRTGIVLSLLVLGTAAVFGVRLGVGDRLAAGVTTLTAGPLSVPSHLGAFVGLAVLFLGTVAVVRRVVAP